MQMQAAPMCVGDRNPAFSEFREFRGHLTYLARLEAAARVLWRSEVAPGIPTGVISGALVQESRGMEQNT